jgi:hypothetical protein
MIGDRIETLLGMKIVSNHAIPERASNFKLDPNVPMTDDFRRGMQTWCDEFFGTHAVFFVIDPASVGLLGGKAILMHPNNLLRIETELPLR